MPRPLRVLLQAGKQTGWRENKMGCEGGLTLTLVMLMAAGLGAGFLFAAPPGAVNTEALRRGLAGGFRAAMSVELGAMVGDTFWLCAALLGTAAILAAPKAQAALTLAGALGLLVLAVRTLRCARKQADRAAEWRPSGRGGFATGALMALVNPFAPAFWLTVGSGLGSVMRAYVGRAPSHLATFVAAFMTGCLAWGVSFSALVAGGRRLITPTLLRRINLVLGLVMAALSVWLWYTLIEMLYG